MYHLIEAPTLNEAISQAWEVLLEKGRIRKRDNQSNKDTCLETSIIINVNRWTKSKYNHYYAPKCVMFESIEDLAEYDLEFKFGIRDDDFNYTYHELYVPYLDKAIQELKDNPDSRRAVLPIAGPASYEDKFPPCLQIMVLSINPENELELTAFFRSNDGVKAFPSNIFAISRFQEYVAKELDLTPGGFTYVVNNFHAYSKDFMGENSMLEGYLKLIKEKPDNAFWDKEEYEKAYYTMCEKWLEKKCRKEE